MKGMLLFVVLFAGIAAGARVCAGAPAGAVLWTYDAGAAISTAPALARDGTVYVGTSMAVHAVTNSGAAASNRWTFATAALGGPAVASDGTIYIANVDGLSALRPDGSQAWHLSAPTQDSTPGRDPAIGADNTIYYVAAGILYAVTPLGSQRWSKDVGGSSSVGVHAPVVSADGTIYVGLEGDVYAVSPAGTNKWSMHSNTWGGATAAPAIGGDGTVYFSMAYLLAFAPNGSNLWSVGRSFFGSPVIDRGGATYVADDMRILHVFSHAGEPLWQVSLGALPYGGNPTAPAFDVGGVAYYCTSNRVWALGPQGVTLWSVAATENDPGGAELANTSPVIGPDGTLYAAIGRTLFAIATGTNGPAASPWPMDRQNPRRTGKVERPTLAQPQKRADANFEFQLYPQQLGLTYTIESTTNFNMWTSLTSFVANTLPVDVVDLTATNAPVRFYRASSPP